MNERVLPSEGSDSYLTSLRADATYRVAVKPDGVSRRIQESNLSSAGCSRMHKTDLPILLEVSSCFRARISSPLVRTFFVVFSFAPFISLSCL